MRIKPENNFRASMTRDVGEFNSSFKQDLSPGDNPSSMQMSAGSNLLLMLQNKDNNGDKQAGEKRNVRNFNFKLINFDEIDKIIEEEEDNDEPPV